MRSKLILAFGGLMAALLALAIASGWVSLALGPPQPEPQTGIPPTPSRSSPTRSPGAPAAAVLPMESAGKKVASVEPPLVELPTPLNKAERLAQICETYRALASGDPKTTMHAAKQLTDDTERETALLALVTEWTHGELASPQRRAWAIATFGIEAGLGMELAHNPELAILWANELTEGQGRAAVLERTAVAMLETDPARAVAMSQGLQVGDVPVFDSVFANWAQQDTDAALQFADQLPDLTDRESAMRAIQSVAPVGIGTELRMQDGLPIINRLLPGTPAETGGQLQPGDRIVGMAQGNNSFVDARGMALADVVQAIRGVPGTLLQLKVLSADAPPDATPRTVTIIREQIKLKR